MKPHLLALLLAGCAAQTPPAPAPEATKVRAITAQKQDVPLEEEWIATAEGKVNARIQAQISGTLLRQNYKDGAFVRRGQLLFEIDPRPAEAALEQAEAQSAQARGQVLQADSQKRAAQAARDQARDQKAQAQAAHQQALGQQQQTQGGLAEAQAHEKRTALDVDKIRPLLGDDAVTQQDLDNAVQLHEAARAQVRSASGLLITAQGAIASAQAQIRLAESAIRAAEAQIGTAEANRVTAQAQLRAAQAAVKQAEIQLGYTRILSPLDGIAGVARVQVGDLVQPGAGDPLTEVSQIDPIKVVFNLPEQQMLAHPDRDWKKASFLIRLSSGKDYAAKGKFFSEDRGVAMATGSVKITALFPNPKQDLKPGQFARIRTQQSVAKGVILVPQEAIFPLLNRDQVAIVKADKKVEYRSVTLGEMVGNRRIIKRGVEPGEVIVLDGSKSAQPGALVEVEKT